MGVLEAEKGDMAGSGVVDEQMVTEGLDRAEVVVSGCHDYGGTF